MWMMDKDDKDASKNVPFRTSTLWCGWDFENHEQLKYAPNFYRIMTNQRVESLVMKGNWEQIRFL